MALRAGYKGVKNTLLSSIKVLASLGIKSLGTMFSVSNKGVLSVKKATSSTPGIVQPDNETITINNGVISAAGGSSFTRELLGSFSEAASTCTLTDDISDYDFVEIILSYPLGSSSNDKAISPSMLIGVDNMPEYVSDDNTNEHILMQIWYNNGCSVAYDSTNHALKVWGRNGSSFIYKVYGIKY